MPLQQDAESTYAKAVKAEFSKDFDSAFRLYIKAAESFLHLSRSVNHEKEKTKWKTSAGKALERAEKIKAFVDKSKAPLNDPSLSETRLTPVGVDHFSPQEQSYALKKGATINGRSFPLWDEKSPSNPSPDSLYEDPDGEVDLSPEQRKAFAQWRRPQSVPAVSDGDGVRLRPQDILQHIITDCSVCASISVCLEHSQRFNSQFGSLSLRNDLDQRADLASPILKSDRGQGRYDLRLWFNGAWRRIVIDDKLPYHPTTSALVCMSTTPVHTIWPSLLEKGYMKLMGGYDFPGSNSSIDLHVLVGWIPEHLEIKSPSFERETTWTRIIDAFLSGRCMLTVGTGVNPDVNWHGVRLLPSHSYAVIDVREDNNSRGFTVLDPWIGMSDRQLEDAQTSRILEIPWTDILEVFDSVYVSWDPRNWPKTLTFHGTWKQSGVADRRSTRHLRLTFDNASNGGENEVWVLLTRHVADTRRTSDFISLRVQLEDDFAGANSGDQRELAIKGTYTNSTHVLARTRLPAQTSGSLSVFAAYDGQAAEVGFTLSVYAPSTAKIAWNENVAPPPFTSKVDGTLTSKNAGGNTTHPTFMINPQYHLCIHPPKHTIPGLAMHKADVAMTMQIGRDVPVNIAVAWSQGGRIFDLTQKDLATTSGAYSYGLARLTKPLQAGDYTIILSAFEPNQLGTFSFEMESSLAFDLKAIPQEGAGMYAKTKSGAWTAQKAMGGPSFKHYAQNPIFELDVQAPTELKIRLQLLRPKAPAALNLSLFPAPASGTAALGRHITTSGAYDDSVAGVATPQVTLGVGKYWIIPSTYSPGVLAKFQLIIYSTTARLGVVERTP
ncbi:hypothetical protein B0H16DRAFT_1572895 [Mycena metata]|uniref:Calpain catalytic domain-containing protein n=1 Tax=Mycena metata TaxID=1033252 RepID=A0AAD7I839_9AGAR|nr:hypothetical protein B0H16DRAFT_1572895 [Mycena metata]